MTDKIIIPAPATLVRGEMLSGPAAYALLQQMIALGNAGGARLLFALLGANMNVTTDQAFTPIFGASSWFMSRAILVNPSTSLTTAAGGLYNAITKPAGGILVAAAQTYANADASGTDGQELTMAKAAIGLQTATPYLSLTTGQGGAATADLYVFGTPMS